METLGEAEANAKALEERNISLKKENASLQVKINHVFLSKRDRVKSFLGERAQRISTQHRRLEALLTDDVMFEGVESSMMDSNEGSFFNEDPDASPMPSEPVKEKPIKEKKMVSLLAGDLVWLRQQDDLQRGTVLTDCSLKALGVQLDDVGSSEFVPPLRLSEGVFRLCSRFNYRSKVEVSKIKKIIRQSDNPELTKQELNLDFAEKRMASEEVQNAELLDRLVRCFPGDHREPIRYGDVVQLQHVNSGHFLAVHKTPAPKNASCRKVTLKPGSLAAQFKILPKFKVRSIGSLVYADDEIVLQSSKHELLYLGASSAVEGNGGGDAEGGLLDHHASEERKTGGPKAAAWYGDPIVDNPRMDMAVPTALLREATAEVNASMELRSFSIKMYHRTEQNGNLLTAMHWFRLFHPEANAFVQASSNTDKGCVLDSAGTDEDPFEGTRLGDIPAHVPYLKHLTSNTDSSNPIHLSAKAVWSFEPIDSTTCENVQWRHMPLRIRHVPSGKYLSVDSSLPTALTPHEIGPSSEAQNARSGAEGQTGEYFDAAMVAEADPGAEEGAFGSPSSMVFFLIPTDVTGNSLRDGTSSIRVEHHSMGVSGSGKVLHLVALREAKPPMLVTTGGEARDDAEDDGLDLGLSMKNPGGRLCFTSEFSALHVLKVQPLAADEASKLRKLTSLVPLFKKYNFAYHEGAETGGKGPPIHLTEAVAGHCIEILNELRRDPNVKQQLLQKVKRKNMSEHLKEVNTIQSQAFRKLYGGEADPRVQKMAYEVKLLDAIFDAALAPYNYGRLALSDGRPFTTPPGSIKPRAVQKFFNAAIQRIMSDNTLVQEYMSRRSSRCWTPNLATNAKVGAIGTNVSMMMEIKDDDEDEEEDDDEEDEDKVDEMKEAEVEKMGQRAKMKAAALSKGKNKPKATATFGVRKWEKWTKIVMSQGEDTLGAMNTLLMLLQSTGNIVKKLVNNDTMKRFQNLMLQCGPEVRLCNLFIAMCDVEKRPTRANQEMVLRKLRLKAYDCFSYGVAFYEVDTTEGIPVLGPIAQPDGSSSQWPRKRAPDDAPYGYLGRDNENLYKQVCVAWTGADEWMGGCGHLWYSPESMLVGAALETRKMEGMEKPVHLVPLEQIMWVIEPERLCEPCTGEKWEPFKVHKKTVTRHDASHASKDAQEEETAAQERVAKSALRKKMFERQVQLANFIVAQVQLFTNLCRGRSYNCIAWLEKTFNYGLLMNVATNPHLPYKLVARVMDLAQALFVDRFPQHKNSGTPVLPEKLWVYDEEVDMEEERMSNTPVIQSQVTLQDETAFPAFFLPKSCSAYGDEDPVMSHKDHYKYYLLRRHCINIIKWFGNAGRMANSSQTLNELGMAAIKGQQNLLKFGFQSTHEKLVDMCVPNGALLDGRSDLKSPGTAFSPPTARYSATSTVVMELKREVIETFFYVSDLCANYRLGQLLSKFKEKTEACNEEGLAAPMTGFSPSGFGSSIKRADHKTGLEHSCTPTQYLMQSSPGAMESLFVDFNAMFPGGSADGAKLDMSVLSDKPDLDQVLIDCIMYKDSNLMAAALRLLDSTYGQRRKLIAAFDEVTLLDHVRIPVYGTVHSLRGNLSELVYLARTSSVWGVKSMISGPWGDERFATIMHLLDKVLTFLHTRYEDEHVSIGDRGEDSFFFTCFGGEFLETDLQGNYYENKKLWNVDVADKWKDDGTTKRTIEPKHQDILRSCNLQEILLESIVLDAEIVWKGSICTEREKIESERRLVMVKRALLVCSIAFTSNNRKNQEIMYAGVKDLEVLATPPQLAEASNVSNFESGRNSDGSDRSGSGSRNSRGSGGRNSRGSRGSGARGSASNARGSAAEKGSSGSSRSSSRKSTAVSSNRERVNRVKRKNEEMEAEELSAEWPRTVTHFAQSLIMTILHGNASLCEGLAHPENMVKLFCHVANLRPDASTSPVLDILFTLCKPESVPIREYQLIVTTSLMMFDRARNNDNMFRSLTQSLGSCAIKAVPIPKYLPVEGLRDDELDDEEGNDDDGGGSGGMPMGMGCPFGGGETSAAAEADGEGAEEKMAEEQAEEKAAAEKAAEDAALAEGAGGRKRSKKMESPQQLVKLVQAVCEGGNETAAAQLKLRCGFSIDATCSAIVHHLECCSANAVKEENEEALAPAVENSEGQQEPRELSPQAVLHLMSHPGGVGSYLLGLLVELVFLLPINQSQIMSSSVWDFLRSCAVPTMEALAQCTHLNKYTSPCCVDLVDVVERLLVSVVRLGLFRVVTEDVLRDRIIAVVAEDLETLLAKRQKSPEALKAAYVKECRDLDAKLLDKEQFIALMVKLTMVEEDDDDENGGGGFGGGGGWQAGSLGDDDVGGGEGEDSVPSLGSMKSGASLLQKHTSFMGSWKLGSTLSIAPALKTKKYTKVKTPSIVAAAAAMANLPPQRREELEDAFAEVDVDGDGFASLDEFQGLCNKLAMAARNRGADNKSMNPTHAFLEHVIKQPGHRLLMRTVECGERVILIRQGQGAELVPPRFNRQDQFGTRTKPKSNKGRKLFGRATAKQLQPAALAFNLRKRPYFLVPLPEKFKRFQQGVRNNPFIIGALQKRRFTMVTILERGTSGPSCDRNAHDDLGSSTNSGGTGMDASRSNGNGNGNGMDASVAKGMDSSLTKTQHAGHHAGHHHRTPFALLGHHHDGGAAAAAAAAAAAVLDLSSAGAVALTWEDVTRRFVSYVGEHFYSIGYGADTCTLIFETWHAHLIKARTWALDKDAHKLPIADMPKAASIKQCDPHELSDSERTSFHWKQDELNRMGVTELLASTISSLGDDVSEGGLPDSAVELFNELLNGGNIHVQDTLYRHLVHKDPNGKLVAHMAKRLDDALQRLVEAKKNENVSQDGPSSGDGSADGGDEGGDAEGGDDGDKDAYDAEACEQAIATARFLQLLCEGHHTEFQNYVRSQPMHSISVDLVKRLCTMLVFVCETTFSGPSFSRVELELVAQLLETLTDTMLGPCAGNQELIAKSDVVAALNLVVHGVNSFDAKLSQKKQDPATLAMLSNIGLRGLSCLLLAACLEGREDHVTHGHLLRSLETPMFEDYRTELEDKIWVVLSKAQHQQRLPRPDEVARIKVDQHFLVAVSTVLTELEKRGGGGVGASQDNSSSAVAASGGGGGGGGQDALERSRRLGAGPKNKDPLVGFVEISWRGKVERTCFPLPFEIKYLSPETKRAFLDSVDMSTSEKRVKALVKKTDAFVREMDLIYHFAEQSKVYRVLHKHLPTVKLANYAIVVALNLNLLLSPGILGTPPATALLDDLDGTNPIDKDKKVSLYFTVALALLSIVGYAVVVGILAATEVPLLTQDLDEIIREDTAKVLSASHSGKIEAHASVSKVMQASVGSGMGPGGGRGGGGGGIVNKKSDGSHLIQGVSEHNSRSDGRDLPLLADEGGPPVTRNPRAWLPLAFGVFIGGIVSILHAFNYEVELMLYAYVMLISTVPFFLRGWRHYVGSRPANLRERLYNIVYDCLLCRPFLRNHVALVGCVVCGLFQYVEFFTLELLDVLYLSPVIADIIKSVTGPGTALSLVLYLFCCSVLIYATFGISHLPEALSAPVFDLNAEDGENPKSRELCDTTLSCFYLIFYQGMSERGNFKNDLVSVNPSDGYIQRIMYDSVFFIWTGIVLMNIITGLMVDTFSRIRGEKQSRMFTLKNDCFVCGILRNTYENYDLSISAPGFDAHIAEDHHLWTYVYYIAYLKKKDPTEDSGIDSYVRGQLKNLTIEWIPSRTCSVLESEGKTGALLQRPAKHHDSLNLGDSGENEKPERRESEVI